MENPPDQKVKDFVTRYKAFTGKPIASAIAIASSSGPTPPSEPVKVSTYLLTDRNFTDFRLLATVKLAKSEMQVGEVD